MGVRLAKWFGVFVLGFIVVSSMPPTIHRRAFDHAYFVWMHNPNPQTEAALHEQMVANEEEYVIVDGTLAATFAAIGFGLATAVKTVRNRGAVRFSRPAERD